MPTRNGDPVQLVEKEGRLEQDAADGVILGGVWFHPAILFDPRPHLCFGLCAVIRAERFPSETDRENREVAEEPAAHNEVIGAVEFEQERLTGLEGAEGRAAAGLPEVDFFGPLALREVGEPITVRDSYIETHRGRSLLEHQLPIRIRGNTFSRKFSRLIERKLGKTN